MTNSPGPQIEIETSKPRSLMTRIIGLVLLISAAVLATYVLVAYFAWQSGRQTQSAASAETAALLHQVEIARQDMARGSTDLALRRLDWVLAQDGLTQAAGRSVALALQGEIKATVQAAAAVIPTITPQPTVEPSATNAATGASVESDIRPELQEIQRLIAAKDWRSALPLILTFQQSNPDFDRSETDQLLYNTYLNLGLDTIRADSTGIELGLNYLAGAERLGTLPPEALDYRYWSDLYLNGIAYYGVNWEVASYYFRDLCAAAPFFQNSCQTLNEILLKQADQLGLAGDWCPAEVILQELWQQDRSQALGDKLSLARGNCALATPVPLTDTVELSGTLPITEPQPGD